MLDSGIWQVGPPMMSASRAASMTLCVIALVAMRAIVAGEDLTTDHAMFTAYEGCMDCNCARLACRGRIGGRDWQRSDLQARYWGYFSL